MEKANIPLPHLQLAPLFLTVSNQFRKGAKKGDNDFIQGRKNELWGKFVVKIWLK